MSFYNVKGRAKCRGDSKKCIAPGWSDRVAIGTRMYASSYGYYCTNCAEKLLKEITESFRRERIRAKQQELKDALEASEPEIIEVVAEESEVLTSSLLSNLDAPKSLKSLMEE